MTPMTMKETFPRVFREGGATPRAQDARRTATGVVACRLSVFARGCGSKYSIPLASE
jgi:hypothetical protein